MARHRPTKDTPDSRTGRWGVRGPTAGPCLLAALLLSTQACAPRDRQPPPAENGELTLILRDAASRQPVPARLELWDQAGKRHIAPDALPILIAEGEAGIHAEFKTSREFRHPQTGRRQFYSSGRSTLSLPAGQYSLSIRKGLEYERRIERIDVGAGEAIEREIELDRWIDMPGRQWYSADDHIHLPRLSPESDAVIHQWMAAEDIHVANLLQMGSRHAFDFAAQYAHGKQGRSRSGGHYLIAGQENPRTHFLGHMILLGTEAPIHYPEEYLDLRKALAEGRRQGALGGFAHGGVHAGGRYGLSLVLHHGLLDFLEVLQFGEGSYDVWYKILNTGFRLAPTAGTDYPWGWSHPGRERFYTRVLGEFTIDKWIEAVRAGHTFVTNGPMLVFRVDGEQMGGAVELARPGPVEIEARVRFNPDEDHVTELELVENGVVVRSRPVGGLGAREIRLPVSHEVRGSGWLAIRASGWKAGQPPGRRALAHSAPVYVSVAGAAPVARREEARRMARAWTALLDDLEAALASEEKIEKLSRRAGTAQIDVKTIEQSRPALLRAIAEARTHFREQSR